MKNLAIAYTVQKNRRRKGHSNPGIKEQMMNEGGEVGCGPMSTKRILDGIANKRLAKGGMVSEHESDDFLSAEEDTEVPHLGYPDLDGVESTEGMAEEDPKAKRRSMLAGIMQKVYSGSK